MITPWDYAGNSEHSHQVAFFMWASRAEKFGFAMANLEANWLFATSKEWAAHGGSSVPELRWLHAIPNGGLRNLTTATRLKAEGVKRGVYDVFWPLRRGSYSGLYIEFKEPGKLKKVSDPRTSEQIEFANFIDTQGYYNSVIDNWQNAAKLVQKYYLFKDAEIV